MNMYYFYPEQNSCLKTSVCDIWQC